MKSTPVFSILFIAIAISVYVQSTRKNLSATDRTIDNLAYGLQGIEQVLHDRATIAIKMTDIDFIYYILTPYVLAPRFCINDPKQKLDTQLCICFAEKSDSVLHRLQSTRKVIWTNKDSSFHYLLTCSR
jgi:hypothetical protein